MRLYLYDGDMRPCVSGSGPERPGSGPRPPQRCLGVSRRRCRRPKGPNPGKGAHTHYRKANVTSTTAARPGEHGGSVSSG